MLSPMLSDRTSQVLILSGFFHGFSFLKDQFLPLTAIFALLQMFLDECCAFVLSL